MKKLFFLFTFILAFAASDLFAQEDKDVSIIFNPADSTYRFVEVTTWDDGESIDTINLRYFPNSWLTGAQFQNYIFQVAASEKERQNELTRLRRETVLNHNFYVETIDTLFGAGTYQNTINASVLQNSQGAWRIIKIKNSDNSRTAWRANLVDNTLVESQAETPLTGTFTVVDEKTATLTWDGVTVSMSLNRMGRWVGTASGHRYVMAR